MRQLTHLAWDEGVIYQAMMEVLGSDIKLKTTKTFCGKRVSLRFIDNTDYTCLKCLEAKNKEK